MRVQWLAGSRCGVFVGFEPFGFLGDRSDRLMNRAFPRARHHIAPALSQRAEVCSKFALPDEFCFPVVRREDEALDDVGHRPAHDPEVDSFWSSELHRFDRRGLTALHLRVVRSQYHVGAALPDIQLLLEGARGASEIRSRDHVEHCLA